MDGLEALTHHVIAFLQANSQLNMAGICTLFLVFAIAELFPLPRTPFCVAAGALYGMKALAIVMPATTLCYFLGFSISRYLFARRFLRYAHKRRILRAILEAVKREGWHIVALIRMASVVPTFLQNYVFGLTRIGLWPYLVASVLCTVPQVSLYIYAGHIGRTYLQHQEKSWLGVTLLAIAAVCILAAVTLITRRVREVLKMQTTE